MPTSAPALKAEAAPSFVAVFASSPQAKPLIFRPIAAEFFLCVLESAGAMQTVMQTLGNAVGKKQVCTFGGLRIGKRPASMPIFCKAPPMPSGLRVNCTAEASAKNSRWRLTPARIQLPKKVPIKPTIISAMPISGNGFVENCCAVNKTNFAKENSRYSRVT